MVYKLAHAAPFRQPKVRSDDCYDRTGFHYIIVRGTVDCFGRVLDIDIQSFFIKSQVGLKTLASLGTLTYSIYFSSQ